MAERVTFPSGERRVRRTPIYSLRFLLYSHTSPDSTIYLHYFPRMQIKHPTCHQHRFLDQRMGLQVQHVLSYTALHSFPLHGLFVLEPVLFRLRSVFHLVFHFALIFCSWRRGNSWWWTDGGRRRRKGEIGNRLSPGEGGGIPRPPRGR